MVGNQTGNPAVNQVCLKRVRIEGDIENRIQELLARCDRVCDYLDPDRGKRQFTHKLRQNFRYEMLKFAVYLSDADGVIETKEVLAIRKHLHSNAVADDLRVLRVREHIRFGFQTATPIPLKAAVLHDSRREDDGGPFGDQCAQIMLDTYKAFGRIFIALHENDPTDKSMPAYTVYIQTLTDYLKQFGVLYPASCKLFYIEELERIEDGEAEEMELTGGEDVREEDIRAADIGAKDVKIEYVHTNSTDREKEGDKEAGNGRYGAECLRHKDGGFQKEKDDSALAKKLEEFHGMIGLSGVKREVDALINLLRIQSLRAANGLQNARTSKHMVFSGNPGTGKTTVARILAGIYKDLGVLEKGTLVEVDRSGLVKGYVGQTAIQVKKVVEQARGGILFIDEAYTLTVGKGESDYGQEAVDTLLKAMEDYREELVVIVAGYPDLMNRFLESNPGLKSRFNKFICFEDYSAEEQLAILKAMCDRQQYVLSRDAYAYMEAYLSRRMKRPHPDFANARDVRNMLERAILRQATRVIGLSNPSREDLQTLTAIDFMV